MIIHCLIIILKHGFALSLHQHLLESKDFIAMKENTEMQFMVSSVRISEQTLAEGPESEGPVRISLCHEAHCSLKLIPLLILLMESL